MCGPRRNVAACVHECSYCVRVSMCVLKRVLCACVFSFLLVTLFSAVKYTIMFYITSFFHNLHASLPPHTSLAIRISALPHFSRVPPSHLAKWSFLSLTLLLPCIIHAFPFSSRTCFTLFFFWGGEGSWLIMNCFLLFFVFFGLIATFLYFFSISFWFSTGPFWSFLAVDIFIIVFPLPLLPIFSIFCSVIFSNY